MLLVLWFAVSGLASLVIGAFIALGGAAEVPKPDNSQSGATAGRGARQSRSARRAAGTAIDGGPLPRRSPRNALASPVLTADNKEHSARV